MDALRCYHCGIMVAMKDLKILGADEDKISLEYNCPECGYTTIFGFRNSWVHDCYQ
jgi:hypothetical protein